MDGFVERHKESREKKKDRKKPKSKLEAILVDRCNNPHIINNSVRTREDNNVKWQFNC